MTSRTFQAHDVSEGVTSLQRPEAAVDARPQLGRPDLYRHPSHSPTVLTFWRTAVVERLPLMPHQGEVPERILTEPQARSLLALGLIEAVGRGRIIRALKIREGRSVAEINAALRQGMGARLPIAADNRTVRRVSEPGGTYFEPQHVAAWDDGRELGCRIGRVFRATRLTRNGIGNGDE